MNAELHEHLMRVTVDVFKQETDKLKTEIAKEKDRNYALDNETFQLTHEMSELHDANNRLKEENVQLRMRLLAEPTARSARSEDEWFAACAALMSNGFTQTVNGSWKPPLGKRPDFEGAALIKAAMAVHVAQRELFDAACKYEERPK